MNSKRFAPSCLLTVFSFMETVAQFTHIRSIVVAVVCVLLTLGCEEYHPKRPIYWTLSPDGSHLVFSWCGYKESPCTIALYGFKSKKLLLYPNETGRHWAQARFSSDGDQLAFSISSSENDDWSQIAIINADGTGFREVTKGKGLRFGPTFSSDGKKLTYMCAGYLSEEYYTPFKGNVRRLREKEICVTDISTGQERRITDLNAYGYSRPYFMPDNRHVLFGYNGSVKDPESKSLEFGKEIVRHIEKPQSQTVLSEMPLANDPTPSSDGRRVVFSARTNEMDNPKESRGFNYDLFLWEGKNDILHAKGTIRRLTKAESYLSGFAFSGDGRKIAYAFDKKRNGEREFFLMDVDSGKVKEFTLPEKPDGWVEKGSF